MYDFKRKVLSLTMVIFLLVGIVGIADTESAYAASKTIHLNKTAPSVIVGQTYQQKLINTNGKVISATKVKWKSKKTAVAKISKKGLVTAVKVGTAKMTATYKGTTYNFTVKVTKPFKSGEKPTITVKQGNDQNVVLTWTGKTLKGLECELRYSVNGGDYELYPEKIGEEFSMAGVVGNTYSFKARWVYNDYYSAYSAVQSVTITADRNTSINTDPSQITLEIGETLVVNIKTDNGRPMTYQRENDNIRCSWGSWLQDGSHTNTLKITGVAAGTSKVDVYDAKDENVRDSISVTVNPEWTVSCNQTMPYVKEVKGSEDTTLYKAKVTDVSLSKSENTITIVVTGTMESYTQGIPELDFVVKDKDDYVVKGDSIEVKVKKAGYNFRITHTVTLTKPKGNYTVEFYN